MSEAPSIDETTEWISAAEAARLLAPVFGSAILARKNICKRAHAGLIRAHAEQFLVGEKKRTNFEIPRLFWWANGEAALRQDWPIGDFDTWVDDGQTHLRAFGVSFLRADIERMIPADQRAQIISAASAEKTARPQHELFPPDIIDETNRSYLKAIAVQMNGCMKEGWYDACAVMMRRLLEAVIIEAYEHHSIADRIKDGAGNYIQLTGLIDVALNEPTFPLSRNVKTVLPRLRDVGHRSAHGRFFAARKSDIEKVEDGVRLAVEEFLHHAGLL